MKILIADDNAAVRTSLRLLLKRHFREVVAIGDPTMIPAILAKGDTDAVLLDMNFDSCRLDGSDGIFWLKRIKEVPNPPAVVMITAFGDIPVAVASMKSGAEDFVTKPWDNELLIEKLNHAIAVNRTNLKIQENAMMASEIKQKVSERENMTLDELKRNHVAMIVEQCGGNLKAAAERLGVNRQTIYNILRKQ